MKARGGFTLLELLMVVIIVAILASIALPQYLRTAERARSTEALTLLAAIRSSELRFKAQDPSGLYTTDLTKLDIDLPGATTTSMSTSLWTITVADTAPGSNVVATRLVSVAGGTGQPKIEIDLDSGLTCVTTGHNNVYGIPATSC